MNSLGLHHHHTKNRNKWIDKIIYPVSIIGQILTIPQITKIWIEHNASGVSAISWGYYTIACCFWLVYGVVHKEKPLIFSYSVWILLNLIVTIGALLYG